MKFMSKNRLKRITIMLLALGLVILTSSSLIITKSLAADDRTGILTVILDGSDIENQPFNYTITFNNGDGSPVEGNLRYTVSGSETIRSTYLTNGQHSFTLRPDNSIRFLDLPYGTSYVVETVKDNGYYANWTDQVGTVSDSNRSPKAIVSYDAAEEYTGVLTVENETEENLAVESFNYTVTLIDNNSDPMKGNVSYILKGTDMIAVAPLTDGVYNFSLGPDGSIRFINIPYGTSYRIEEESSNDYETTWTEEKGIITSSNSNPIAKSINNTANIQTLVPDNSASTPASQSQLTVKMYQSVNNGQKTQSAMNINPGDLVTYYLEVTNSTSSAINNVVISDDIPSGLIILPESVEGNGAMFNDSETQVYWNIASIAAGQTLNFAVPCRVENTLALNTNLSNKFNVTYNGSTISSNGAVITYSGAASGNTNTNPSTPSTPSTGTTTDTPITVLPGETVNTATTVVTGAPQTGIDTVTTIILIIIALAAASVLIYRKYALKK